jgi:hypothetical protein
MTDLLPGAPPLTKDRLLIPLIVTTRQILKLRDLQRRQRIE